MSLPRYPEYKDSGVAWLGEVPAHWIVAKTVRYFKIAMGQTILKEDLVDAGDWPVFSATDGDHYFGYINNPDVRLDIGDLVIPARGNSIGAVKEVKEPSTTTQTTIYCKNLRKDWVLQRYSYHFMVGSKTNLFFFTQTAIPQITVQEVGANPLLLPPLDEQTAIATFLDRETTKIDALIAEQEKLRFFLDEKISALVLREILNAESNQIRLGQVVEVICRPVQLSEGSIFVPLGLYNRGRGIFKKEETAASDMGDSDFFRIEKGDLVISGQFAWEGAVALAGDEEDGCVVSHRYPVIRGIEGVTKTEYLLALLLTKHGDFLLNESSRGSAGRNRPLNLGSLLKEKITVPPMNIQEEIADLVHARIRMCQEIEIQRNLLLEHRSTLISAAVTGKIDVRHLANQEAA